jgi:hypothetical protein
MSSSPACPAPDPGSSAGLLTVTEIAVTAKSVVRRVHAGAAYLVATILRTIQAVAAIPWRPHGFPGRPARKPTNSETSCEWRELVWRRRKRFAGTRPPYLERDFFAPTDGANSIRE